MARAATAERASLLACVHCGFCLPACPTYRLLGEENDSPRGRLYLMRAEEEGRIGRSGALTLHLDRCLGCRACETVCPAGVAYGALLERTRDGIPRGRLRAVAASVGLTLLTGRSLARAIYALGRALRAGGFAEALARVLPGRVGLALGLLAATRPTWHSTPGGPPLPAHGAATGARLRGEAGASGATPRRTYALLEGCVMAGLFGHVHGATRRILERRGLHEAAAPGQACCGALHAHAGRLDRARALARRNVEAFEKTGGAWIVVDSAGCGAALRDYPVWLAGSEEWEPRARAVADRVRDVSELAAEAPAAPGATARLEGRVAYDAPCHLLHAQGIAEEPLAMLRRIDDLVVEALPSSDRCCGSAGLYSLARPRLAAGVREPKLEEVRRGSYDWLATGNPGCIMFLGAGLGRAGATTRVVHPAELLDVAESGASGEA